MFGRPADYPATPTIDEMKDKISRMKINTLGGFLADLMDCRIPLKLIIDNGPLIERFIGRSRRRDEDEIYEFTRWLKKRFAKPGLKEIELLRKGEDEGLEPTEKEQLDAYKQARETQLEASLEPSERLFAEYAGVDLNKVEEEKQAVLAWMRAQQQAAEAPAEAMHAPLPKLPGSGGMN